MPALLRRETVLRAGDEHSPLVSLLFPLLGMMPLQGWCKHRELRCERWPREDAGMPRLWGWTRLFSALHNNGVVPERQSTCQLPQAACPVKRRRLQRLQQRLQRCEALGTLGIGVESHARIGTITHIDVMAL